MYPILLAVLLQTGQTWSPAQQEIIEQIKRCNDAWVSSIEQKRFEPNVVWKLAGIRDKRQGGLGRLKGRRVV